MCVIKWWKGGVWFKSGKDCRPVGKEHRRWIAFVVGLWKMELGGHHASHLSNKWDRSMRLCSAATVTAPQEQNGRNGPGNGFLGENMLKQQIKDATQITAYRLLVCVCLCVVLLLFLCCSHLGQQRGWKSTISSVPSVWDWTEPKSIFRLPAQTTAKCQKDHPKNTRKDPAAPSQRW